MNHEMRRVIEDVREAGVSVRELISAMMEMDKSYAYDFITEEIVRCIQSGASAEFAFSKLLDFVSEEQIDTYIKVQKYVDAIMSVDGLEIITEDIEFIEEMEEPIRLELKNRGVKYVSYVLDSIDGVVTIKDTDDAMEMRAWDDMYCKVESKFYNSFYEDIKDGMAEECCYEEFGCCVELDVENEVDDALAYRDIHEVLSSKDTSGFSKHEFDIYFAYQAVMGNIMYYDEDVAVEAVRLTEYWYGGYEYILDALERLDRHDYEVGIDECASFNELIIKKAECRMEDWYCYSGEFIYGTEVL